MVGAREGSKTNNKVNSAMVGATECDKISNKVYFAIEKVLRPVKS